ncbi:hypothetical protein DFAR_2810051 [Desulfarculales bacterium]
MADQTILLTGSLADCPYPLRRLVVLDEKNQKQVVFLTNHHKLPPSWLTSIKIAGRSSCSSRRLSKTLRSKLSCAPAATLWKPRVGQPCSHCSCSSGFAILPWSHGHCRIWPPCCA